MEFLWHQPDGCSRCAVVSHGVVTVGDDGSRSGIDDTTDDVNQRRLARTIGSEQGEYLTTLYLQVDFFEYLKITGICLVNLAHEDDRDRFFGGHRGRCGYFIHQ